MREPLRPTFVTGSAALDDLRVIASKPVRLHRVDRIPPQSFALFANGCSEVLPTEDAKAMIDRLIHRLWESLKNESK